ncbi:sigma 54-interacting transcriptional regulator [Paraliomyxa miuraensis]|uniref:sigma 54-interacting transcriptional regulator n=1 Tax=Paraliomyxa miuraensis TaxID=376150 RepID=UPI002253119F|nr:sigma 54-interacting transcriptional regulator [Paraliomyxa miuraensis]MCX4245362.1 sigma 54-interacting transcriptional regulator [Paraliomyxa miuraensis]
MSTVATLYGEPLEGGPRRSQLEVVEGRDLGRAVALVEGRDTRVGTASDCDLVLTDERVSGHHLRVRPDGDGFHVHDEGSTNGTHYQGSRIDAARLPAGAVLKIGRTVLRLQPQAAALDLPPSRSRRFGELVGESLALRQAFAVLELAARSDVTVLLEGETGTGKELAARALHEASARRRGPFVAVDCGALPETLVDSELFGHVRGAFTGATSDRKGAFARASGGTLFLDELDGISATVQARLLRALEERVIRPVGSDRELPLDVRLVVATQTPLPARVAEGRFRADLFYRIAVLHLRLPPLRERREDVGPIVAELLRRRGLEPGGVEGPGLQRLCAHDWPGNVRELRNAIDRAVALSPGVTGFEGLRLWLPAREPEPSSLAIHTDVPFAAAKAAVIEEFERRYLGELWAQHDGNLSAAARQAGLDRKHLRTLLRRHGLIPGDP